MTTFVALYRGASLSEAELVAVSADAALVNHVAGAMLQGQKATPHRREDPAVAALSRGRRRALKIAWAEAQRRAERSR